MTEHPITPPAWLINQLCQEEGVEITTPPRWFHAVCTKLARWGADQELEACYGWLNFYAADVDARDLRTARRPKPKSQAEEALTDFDGLMDELDGGGNYSICAERIRRALQRLQELEGSND